MVRTSGVGRKDHRFSGILSAERRMLFFMMPYMPCDVPISGLCELVCAASAAANNVMVMVSLMALVLLPSEMGTTHYSLRPPRSHVVNGRALTYDDRNE